LADQLEQSKRGRAVKDHPIILALDLGSKTGWAIRTKAGVFRSGVSEFKPNRFEGGGMGFLRFEAFLREHQTLNGPLSAVVFEEVRSHAGTLAAQVYGGFLAHLSAWAEREKIPYKGVPVGVIKRHAAGKGNASKLEVIQAVRLMGFDPKDDNEADALALLDWAVFSKIGETQ
jgi:crossover junction endodeoxyribonuclease RuvC